MAQAVRGVPPRTPAGGPGRRAPLLRAYYRPSRRQVPAGVFSRLLGALASLCQQTEPYPSVHRMALRRGGGAFSLGGTRFAVARCATHLAIRVERGTGHAVAEVLGGQLRAILDLYVPGFGFLLLVPADGGADPARAGYDAYDGALAVLSGPGASRRGWSGGRARWL